MFVMSEAPLYCYLYGIFASSFSLHETNRLIPVQRLMPLSRLLAGVGANFGLSFTEGVRKKRAARLMYLESNGVDFKYTVVERVGHT